MDGDYVGQVILDFDHQDHMIGIEVLEASKLLPRRVLAPAGLPAEPISVKVNDW